ncbi:hypothetical protein SSS_00343 [Sarcoptes scabiei]|uniref:Suppressor of cytokine signaling 7 n=1 Tax=Sarcoptes scabiei TaxID=52283 RepID=A0A834R3T4_SARSC|nr:hypothetical protein SSS_00343 [Sarcoptes scabiei]
MNDRHTGNEFVSQSNSAGIVHNPTPIIPEMDTTSNSNFQEKYKILENRTLNSNEEQNFCSNEFSYIDEPIHMTLEEARRSDVGIAKKSTRTNSSCSNVIEKFSTCTTPSFLRGFFESLFHRNNRYSFNKSEEISYKKPIQISTIRICEQDHDFKQSRRKFKQKDSISSPFVRRALPPLPSGMSEQSFSRNVEQSTSNNEPEVIAKSAKKLRKEYEDQKYLHYVTSIGNVKKYGWYWGAISGDMAENLLQDEPSGSFLVRDSADEHYIFSLSFKLDGVVRHVRIEQECGTFHFGSYSKFRSSSIIDFMDNAMKHSRDGNLQFFLRLGPSVGPIRVQLLRPVSRFMHIQSLENVCRFTIQQFLRRDQIAQLPLPANLLNYLMTPSYYQQAFLPGIDADAKYNCKKINSSRNETRNEGEENSKEIFFSSLKKESPRNFEADQFMNDIYEFYNDDDYENEC